MIIGVIGFYFVVSNINSIISSSIRINMAFTAKITQLSKLNKKYKLDPELFKMVRSSLINEDYKRDISNFKPMFKKFPKYLRKELKYEMYKKVFGNFRILLGLQKKVLNSIGDHVTPLNFQESNIN